MGAGTERTANTTNLYFDHVEAEALVIALDLKGLSVSGGSACQSGATGALACVDLRWGSPRLVRGPACASRCPRLTTEAEIDEALAIIPEAVARLRALSPTWQKTRVLASV